jgi:hypothetical protein
MRGNLKCRKAQAGVIGGIVIAMLIFSIILPLILMYQQTAGYISTQSIVELNFLNEKLKENIAAVGSKDGSEITATNEGSIQVTLVRLWLVRNSYVELVIDIKPGAGGIITDVLIDGKPVAGIMPTLKPGSTLTIRLDASKLTNLNQLYFYLESDRGVLHPREKAQPLVEIPGIPPEIIEFLAQTHFGPIIYWFFSLEYYEVQTRRGKDWIDLSDGYEGFVLPSKEDIVLAIMVTNYDPQHRSITIDSRSQIELYPIKPTEASEQKFSIVSVDNNGYIKNFDSITLGYGESTRLYFRGSTPNKSTEAFLSIVLLGNFSDGSVYGQSIAVVGVKVE